MVLFGSGQLIVGIGVLPGVCYFSWAYVMIYTYRLSGRVVLLCAVLDGTCEDSCIEYRAEVVGACVAH